MGLLGGGSADAMSVIIRDSTTQRKANKHPCLEWDSNPQSKYPSLQVCDRVAALIRINDIYFAK
jgi:hypothetical protein